MRKVICGIGFLFAGVMLYLSAGVVGHLNIQYTTSWDTGLGRGMQSLMDSGMLPALIMGYLLVLTGITIALVGAFEKRSARARNAPAGDDKKEGDAVE